MLKRIAFIIILSLLVVGSCNCEETVDCYDECVLYCQYGADMCDPELQDCSIFENCYDTCYDECCYGCSPTITDDSGVSDGNLPKCWPMCQCEFEDDPNASCQECIQMRRAEGTCS